MNLIVISQNFTGDKKQFKIEINNAIQQCLSQF